MVGYLGFAFLFLFLSLKILLKHLYFLDKHWYGFYGQRFCCSSHPRTLDTLISGHFWVDRRTVLIWQAVDKLLKLKTILHWYIWHRVFRCSISLRTLDPWSQATPEWIQIVLSTWTVLTQQVLDKLVITVEHCRQGWTLHWTYHTTFRHWTSGHAYMCV